MNRMFIYTQEFEKLWKQTFDTFENLIALETSLLENPKSGDVIKSTAGLRKLRWQAAGKGKRGGIRIYYVDFEEEQIIFFIILIKKNEQIDITANHKKIVNEIITSTKHNLNQYYGKGKSKK